MEGLLPSEMVARIASYLSYKDANSLGRTSKTVRAKLETYRNLVPKVPVELRIKTSTDKIELSVGWAPEYGSINSMVRTVTLTGAGTSTVLIREEDVRNSIVQFYLEYQGEPRKETEQSFAEGRFHGLSLHIQMLQTIASIRNIHLNADHDIMDDIMRVVKLDEHSRVEELQIRTTNITTSQLNFIAKCNLFHLEIDTSTGSLPKDFYNMPVVHKVPVLFDYSNECTVHDLCSLAATEIAIFGRTNLTLNDVKQFFKQWLESKREIADVILNMSEIVSVEQWRAMLEEENTDPWEDEEPGWEGMHMNDYTKWHLKRPSDGESLICRAYADNTIELTRY